MVMDYHIDMALEDAARTLEKIAKIEAKKVKLEEMKAITILLQEYISGKGTGLTAETAKYMREAVNSYFSSISQEELTEKSNIEHKTR